jgi:hypothetical protein
MSKGVLVGCDAAHEWMLPWWWAHYRNHNSYPVAFVDFGMTSSAQKWCQGQGHLVSLEAPRNFVFPKALIAPELVEAWEKKQGKEVWKGREVCFYKPFALKQTPFDETVWVDLDCEIKGSLAPLFSKVHAYSKIALAMNLEEYDTHVIAYHSTSPLLHRWAELCRWHSDRFLGDQEALTFLIQTEEIEVAELPSQYKGFHPEALIFHWADSWGKEVIRRGLKD